MKRTSSQTSALHSYQTSTLRQVDSLFLFGPNPSYPAQTSPHTLTHPHTRATTAVYISEYHNLWYYDPQANYEHLRDFFSDVGGVTAIRILKDRFTGKSRVSLSLSLSHTHPFLSISFACQQELNLPVKLQYLLPSCS